MSKVIFDIIHGFIEVDELALSIIDKPEFQRLKNIKQLGIVHNVFPSATHTRFEHSLGVYHLAGELLLNLKKNQPELDLNDREIQLIKIAGLCHDLGHGPFSHLLDNYILNGINNINREHENRSYNILGYMITKYNLGISSEELDFISKIINPKIISNDKIKKNKIKENKDKREFIYEIINNERNGIDVDKFDYIKRDSFYCGLSYSMDCSRILKHIRVIDNKLCYLDKSFNYINDMYDVRNKLHKQIYKHKVCLGIELMVVEILKLLHSFYNFNKCIDNAELFCKLDDNILDSIYNTDIKKFDFRCKKEIYNAQILINRIKTRKLFKFISFTDYNCIRNRKEKDFVRVKYNLGINNPFDNIYFYNKNDLGKKFKKSNEDYNNNCREEIKIFIK
jgi:HD superfamily phosphohydrolase